MAWDWVLRKLESVCIGRLLLCSDWPLECLQERPKAVSFLLRKKKQAGTSGLLVYHTQAVLMIRALVHSPHQLSLHPTKYKV